MNRLKSITATSDIPHHLADTPIGRLIEYHNLARVHDSYTNAQLLVGMCMDNRKQLRIPENFSFIIRTGGANLRYSEFKVSFTISIGGIRHIALLGHNHCGMVNLLSKKSQFVEGLVEHAGWDRKQAEEHFMHFSPIFEIGNEIDFILNETKRLRLRYPKITIAPLLYKVEDNKLYIIEEEV